MAVRVRVHIEAPIERVFEDVSDHERFLDAGDGTITRIVHAGASTRNGLGCLREVRAGRGGRYLEEITAWEPPTSFEYLIRETSMPLRHSGGRLAFTKAGAGTDVEWTSQFEMTVPVVGRLLTRFAENLLARAFANLLERTKARLEARPSRSK